MRTVHSPQGLLQGVSSGAYIVLVGGCPMLDWEPGCPARVGASLPPSLPDTCTASWAWNFKVAFLGILALMPARVQCCSLPGRSPGQTKDKPNDFWAHLVL